MSSTPEPTVQPYEPTPPEDLLARAKGRSAAARRRRLLGGSGSLTAVAAILVVSVLVAGGSNRPQRRPGQVVVSARIGSAYELTAGEKALAPAGAGVARHVENAEVGFSLSLLKNLAAAGSSVSPDNVLVSPSSLAIALAMLELGAAGSTQQEVAATLQSTGLSAVRAGRRVAHPGHLALGRNLSRRDEHPTRARARHRERVLFLQQHFAVLSAFVGALSADFETGLWQVDFHDVSAATAAMNQWTSEHTHGLINQLFSPGTISAQTVLVLADAVYFHADWAQSFESATRSRPFYPASGTPENVPFMSSAPVDSPHALTVPVSDTPGYVAVELPYAGRKLSALVVMPTSSSLAEFVGSLGTAELAQIVGGMSSAAVDLSMPTFTLRSDYQLNQTLSTLGMPDAFGPNADFTAIAPNPPLQVGVVEQHAYLQITPKGTTAAAATGISVLPTAVRQGPEPIVVDHPFLFMIRDDATGTILFESMVENPAS